MSAAPLDPKVFQPDMSWRNRLPGTAGGPQQPSYSSPEGLYQYIMGQVPGISSQAAAWMHGEILGGRPFLQNAHMLGVPGVGASRTGGGGPVSPFASGGPYSGLTQAQIAAISQLKPFGQYASNVQPLVPGGAQYLHAGGPFVPGTPGTVGWTNPHDPVLNPPKPPDTPTATPPPVWTGPGGIVPGPGWTGVGPLPTYGDIGLQPMPATPMPGWNTPDPRGGRDPWNDPDWRMGDTNLGAGNYLPQPVFNPGVNDPFGPSTNVAPQPRLPHRPPAEDYGGIGAGAFLAEQSLGMGAGAYRDDFGASPVKYLGRRKRSWEL